MINLLQETLDVLARHGKTPQDVQWVGTPDIWFTWDDFEKLADVEYDNDYGSMGGVITGLMVVGEDWWLEREEYDGASWWEYKQLPSRPSAYEVPSGLVSPFAQR